MLQCGYSKSLDVFNDETRRSFKKAAGADSGTKSLMNAFTQGKWDLFFKLWSRHLPADVREDDLNALKIEFYIQIYFTIFPIHPVTGKASAEKEFSKASKEFKAFLETRGSDLSKTNEFLAYYALPYVTNPREHPSFKQMFSKDWVETITNSTRDFLKKNVIQKKGGVLVQMYHNFKRTQRNQGEESTEDIAELE